MNKTKIWFIIASSLSLLGLVIFSCAMANNHWDFTKLNTQKFETNIYEIGDDFTDIAISTDTADIIFASSKDGKCRVVCHETENARHSVVTNGYTLNISEVNERQWYDYIGITIASPKITIYLPKTEYNILSVKEYTGDIEIPSGFRFNKMDIKTSTGDISADGLSVGALDFSTSTGDISLSSVTSDGEVKIDVSTGDIELYDLVCGAVISSGSTGDILMKNTIASERFFIKRSTGCVSFDGSDSPKIFIKTDTGDVIGSLLSGKIFLAESDTGSVKIPNSTDGGSCDIKTSTGDIKITVK